MRRSAFQHAGWRLGWALAILLLAGQVSWAQDAGWFAARQRQFAAWQALPANAPAKRSSVWDCSECPEMRVVPAGQQTLGSPPAELGRHATEGPQHRVTLARPLAVGRHEVTRGEYRRFVQETGRASNGCHLWMGNAMAFDPARSWREPGYPQTDDHPVVCVDWQDIQAYAAWLSAKTGHHYRPLSEAEWEFAARAGTRTAYFWGNNTDLACRHANVWDQGVKAVFPQAREMLNCSDGFVYSAPVGSFLPNALGLHDMAGNVWEWTADCWNPSHAGAPPDGQARTTGDCDLRVVRGGSWTFYAPLPRSALRVRHSVVVPAHHVGFRLARPL